MALRVLEKKLKRVQEMRTDSRAMLESLDALASFPQERNNRENVKLTRASKTVQANTVQSRRNLRADLESHGLSLIKEFIAEFEGVQQRIASVQDSVDGIQEQCDTMLSKIEASENERMEFVALTDKLVEERNAAKAKAEAMDSFMEKFHLTAEQMQALKEGPDENNEKKSMMFFNTLEHITQIRQESHSLLETQFQSAGLEIFDVMAKNQNAAHKVLFEWVQEQCSRFDADAPEPSPILYTALRALQSVEAYHKLSIEYVVNSRKNALVRKLRIALIHGGPKGRPRPIQMHSHDPVRYVGDVMAWLHQAVAFEKDLVKALFTSEDAKSGDEEAIAETLSNIFQSLSEPIATQIQQVLDNTPHFVTLYKIANILSFYIETLEPIFSQTRGAEDLMQTLVSMQKDVMTTFFDAINTRTKKLLASPPAYPADLSVSVEVLELVRRLSDLLELYNHSLSNQGQLEMAEKEEKFAPVLEAIVTPLVKLCKASASGLDRIDAGVYIINNIFAIQEVMTEFDFTASYVQKLAIEIGDWIDHIVSEQVKKILTHCDMFDKMKHLQGPPPAATKPGMEVSAMQSALQKLYQSMFTLVVPEFDRLNNPRVRENARTSTARSISTTYEKVYTTMMSDTSGYDKDDLQKMLQHSPEQVAKYVLDA